MRKFALLGHPVLSSNFFIFHVREARLPDMGKFLTVLQWKMLVYYVSIWYIFWLLGIFFGYLGKILAIWSSISRFGILYQENLATLTRRELQLKLKVAKTQHIRCTFKAG
jgi:hypothetical protein